MSSWVTLLLLLLLMLLDNCWVTSSTLMEEIWILLLSRFRNLITWINIVVIVDSANILCCIYIVTVIYWCNTKVIYICINHELNCWNLSRRRLWLAMATIIFIINQVLSKCTLKSIICLRIMPLLEYILGIF